MSIEHTPPSTYILRELNDVTVPDSISWVPQTIGWKVLLVVLIIVAAYLSYRWLLRWWCNRYRTEAIEALTHLSIEHHHFEDILFSILKMVLVYLDPANGKLFGRSFLQKIDELSDESTLFNDEIAQKWVQSLVNPSTVLDSREREILRQRAVLWAKTHQGNSQKFASVRSLFDKRSNERTGRGESRHV
ncbi:DUF4381 domain-containing protein [Photobacterium sp. DNB23_23_1]|uniref:DUF4381 domain-containing protein n=1 Tax=Photobacterium pectinilyticum TaxID=2906793 RepID=A0ABT1N6X3_9GAMM|nr:DUF4381 domain-containing protein [Photobacterium sp. ZSDE20]MCQ1058989.1 DUF4381 domain-containing protein [Photobacterium sp. ZSDE20]MDD1823996.1 DUF4381 domain-containing protein [Photobacterium sp. ZSDE20]